MRSGSTGRFAVGRIHTLVHEYSRLPVESIRAFLREYK